MKAIRYRGPGELALLDVTEPRLRDGEVLVDVVALGICGSDLLLWSGGFERVTPPVTIGHEFSGVVADSNNSSIPQGTRVVVDPLVNCGECPPCVRGDYNVCVRLRLLGIDVDGAGAHQVAVSASRLHPIPDGLDLTLAALTEPTAVALHMWQRSGASADDTILIVGGGPIGALVASVSRSKGARRVVVSEPNGSRRALLSGLGFETFDPSGGDFASLLGSLDSDGFDVAFELTGVPAGLRSAMAGVRVQGVVLLGGIPHDDPVFPGAQAVMKELELRGARTYRSHNIDDAIDLLAGGAISPSLITRVVPIDNAIEDAFEVLKTSRDEMKILITINHPSS
jgi:2-desacetyl-2-hydroxyethyl bacteriochlorophyllide A dehydrogenase